MKKWINPAQAICLKSYAEGEFAHLLDCEKEKKFNKMVASCGDTLLKFLLNELATSESCITMDEACRRVDRASRELQAVCAALEQEPEIAWEEAGSAMGVTP